MNNKDEQNVGYTIAIVILSFFIVIMLMIIAIGVRIIDDLNDTIDMHKNTIGVCNIDLEQVQKENEKLRDNCLK